MEKEIVLSAEVYDKLKAEAEKVGGVGKSDWFAFGATGVDLMCPVCINGLAVVANVGDIWTETCCGALIPRNAVGINFGQNDRAVANLIARGQYTTDKYDIRRVSWEDYTAEVNIVRGS